jgi:hypothetical protein
MHLLQFIFFEDVGKGFSFIFFNYLLFFLEEITVFLRYLGFHVFYFTRFYIKYHQIYTIEDIITLLTAYFRIEAKESNKSVPALVVVYMLAIV